MNIVSITQITPTEDNFNGPSALMYHLLLLRARKFHFISLQMKGTFYVIFKCNKNG